VTVMDGRRDGREGAEGAEATNETPVGLNQQIIQNSTATDGVTATAVNLFQPITTTTGLLGDELTTAQATALAEPVYVIPTGEAVKVTIVYDVETTNGNLSGYLSDGVTHGISVENTITRSIRFNTDAGSATSALQSGKKYTLKLHLGMNSVKFDADVADWDDTDNLTAQGWLPDAGSEGGLGSVNSNVILGLDGSAATGATVTNSTDGLPDGVQALVRYALPYGVAAPAAFQLAAFDSDGTTPLNVVWETSDDQIVDIQDPSSGVRQFFEGMFRAPRKAPKSLTGMSTVKLVPMGKGEATISATYTEADGTTKHTSTVVIAIDMPKITLDTHLATLYEGDELQLAPTLYKSDLEVQYTVKEVRKDGTVKEGSGDESDHATSILTASAGLLTAISGSQAYTDVDDRDTVVVYCRAEANTEVYDSCKVIVCKPTIRLNYTDLYLNTNQKVQTLSATVAPSGRLVQWSVLDSAPDGEAAISASGVTVADGRVAYDGTGSEGITYVQAKIMGTEVVAVCKVHVENADPGTLLSVATSADVLKIITTDGKLYASVGQAKAWGQTPVAMVAYVSDNASTDSVESKYGEDQYYKGLAWALKDESGTKKWYTAPEVCTECSANALFSNASGKETRVTSVAQAKSRNYAYAGLAKTQFLASGTHVHAAAQAAWNCTTEQPSGVSHWFLPTLGQQIKMVEAITKTWKPEVAALAWYNNTNDDYKAAAFNAIITPVGATGVQSGNYWSSSETNATAACVMHFGYGYVAYPAKATARYVRPVFAF